MDNKIDRDTTDRYIYKQRSDLIQRLGDNPVFQRASQLFTKPVDELFRYDGSKLLAEIEEAGLEIADLLAFDSMNRNSMGSASKVEVREFRVDPKTNSLWVLTGDNRRIALKPYNYEIDDMGVYFGKIGHTLPIRAGTSDNSLSVIDFNLTLK